MIVQGIPFFSERKALLCKSTYNNTVISKVPLLILRNYFELAICCSPVSWFVHITSSAISSGFVSTVRSTLIVISLAEHTNEVSPSEDPTSLNIISISHFYQYFTHPHYSRQLCCLKHNNKRLQQAISNF